MNICTCRRERPEKKKYEIDFMIVKKKKICPIEVKSSNYMSHKSFDYLIQKYQLKCENRFIIYTEGFKISGRNYVYTNLYDYVTVR